MVYLFLAEGFEEIEAITPIDILRRAGIEIKAVTINGNREVKGRSGIGVIADITIDEVQTDKMEMVILPGGMPGTKNLDQDEQVQNIIQYAVDNDRWIAAICAAPTILGKAGYLKEKDAVCYPGCEEDLKGAVIGDKPVVRCGKIITSKGAGTAIDFSLELVSALRSEALAAKVGKEIIYG